MGRRHGSLLVAAGLLLIAANLRLPITSVGPVLDDIRDGLGVSSSVAGTATTLPVLCFALAGAAVPAFARRVGEEAALLVGMLVLAAGCALRIVPAIVPFFLGTLLAGVAIATANVLLPAVIKRDFPRPGTMMGLYTAIMTAAAAIAAGVTVPLEHALGSWNAALAVCAVPAFVAAVVWLPQARAAEREPAAERGQRIRLGRDPLAWLITGLFAFQSSMFYAVATWVPDLLRDAGMSDGRAGAMLSIIMLLGIPGALAVPVLAVRLRDQRPLVVAAVLLWFAGLGALLVAPVALAPLAAVAVGMAQGAGFSLAMTLVVLRAPDGAHATALSGMVQGVGYLLSASGPVLFGILHDLSGGWTAPLVAMLVYAVGMLACGLGAGGPRRLRNRAAAAAQGAY